MRNRQVGPDITKKVASTQYAKHPEKSSGKPQLREPLTVAEMKSLLPVLNKTASAIRSKSSDDSETKALKKCCMASIARLRRRINARLKGLKGGAR